MYMCLFDCLFVVDGLILTFLANRLDLANILFVFLCVCVCFVVVVVVVVVVAISFREGDITDSQSVEKHTDLAYYLVQLS